MAKGRDLHDAAMNIETLTESASNLKTALDCFAEKLEQARERIEGGTRLHHLLSIHERDVQMQQELERLALQIGGSNLLEKCRQTNQAPVMRNKPTTLNLNFSQNSKKSIIYSSTPASKSNRASLRASSGVGSFEGQSCHCWREDMDEMLDNQEDDEEEQSKIADSGVGGCERCEGNTKLTRVCSCQSLNEAENLYDKR